MLSLLAERQRPQSAQVILKVHRMGWESESYRMWASPWTKSPWPPWSKIPISVLQFPGLIGGRWQTECVDRHVCLSCVVVARIFPYPYTAWETSAAFAPCEQMRAGHPEALAKLDAALSNITLQTREWSFQDSNAGVMRTFRAYVRNNMLRIWNMNERRGHHNLWLIV